ncbi:phage/plasmid primase, P4 family [Streptomyces sp. NPDC059002]|uniref:DNA primase family protein n=1 Tax=Streptomyces sp. NPDC059002 TaxID=3346690 RepID=UPI0036A141CD
MTHDQADEILRNAGVKTATVPTPGNPMAVARVVLPTWTDEEQRPTLLHWRGQWMEWQCTHWTELDVAEVRAVAYAELEHAEYAVTVQRGATEGEELRPWAPNKKKIADLLEAMAAIRILSPSVDAPAWTGGRPAGDAEPVVACANGLLHVLSRRLDPLNPRYFNLVSVPFDYAAKAPAPARWLDFLRQLWPEDPDQIDVLQEFFGYVLSGRTDMHKILLIVGPPRSGKGTIARTLGALVGQGNMAGPTLASLATNFGLSPLLGKPLAIISDARLGGRDGHQVVERLLTVSGEDTIDVDRKYKDPWTGRLPTRFLILSNELPNFGDASGAIATRFLVLNMTASWLGREDRALGAALHAELPGILNWALDGLARLLAQGRFTEPESSREAVTAMQDQASPMSAFTREVCEVGPGHEVPVDALFQAWKTWCEDNERKPGPKQLFGRNLLAVVPQVKTYRPHGQPRRYQGVALKSCAHNGAASGSSGSSGTHPHAEPAREPLAGMPSGSSPRPESAGQTPNLSPGAAADPLEPLPGALSAQLPPLNRSDTEASGSGPAPLCAKCGHPMTVLTQGQTTHPTCGTDAAA